MAVIIIGNIIITAILLCDNDSKAPSLKGPAYQIL